MIGVGFVGLWEGAEECVCLVFWCPLSGRPYWRSPGVGSCSLTNCFNRFEGFLVIPNNSQLSQAKGFEGFEGFEGLGVSVDVARGTHPYPF